MVQFLAPWSAVAIGCTPPWLMCTPAVFTIHTCFSACFCSNKWIDLLLLLFHSINFFYCLLLPLLALSGHFCASTLPTHANTWLLVTSLVFLIIVSFHIILIIISSTVMPFINCSINLPSFSLYLPLFAFILSCLINSLTFSFCSLVILQHCNDKIVSLCWSLNLLLNPSNYPMFTLLFSFSSSIHFIRPLSFPCVL